MRRRNQASSYLGCERQYLTDFASRVFEAGSWKCDARARVDGGYDAEIWFSREGSEVRSSVQKGAVD